MRRKPDFIWSDESRNLQWTVLFGLHSGQWDSTVGLKHQHAVNISNFCQVRYCRRSKCAETFEAKVLKESRWDPEYRLQKMCSGSQWTTCIFFRNFDEDRKSPKNLAALEGYTYFQKQRIEEPCGQLSSDQPYLCRKQSIWKSEISIYYSASAVRKSPFSELAWLSTWPLNSHEFIGGQLSMDHATCKCETSNGHNLHRLCESFSYSLI